MGGVDVGGGGGGKGRRSLDSEINMIPMIDLLMVTVSFLLITAVWSQMARINADAQVPGPPQPDPPTDKPEQVRQLHVEMRDASKFQLIWKQGQTVVTTSEVPREEQNEAKMMADKKRVVSYPALATKVQEEWKANGNYKDPTEKKLDQAILHTDNNTQYAKIIGVIDAIYSAQRPREVVTEKGKQILPLPAFNVTFSVN